MSQCDIFLLTFDSSADSSRPEGEGDGVLPTIPKSAHVADIGYSSGTRARRRRSAGEVGYFWWSDEGHEQ